MSENLNRSNPDFSKYDSMSIGELEEILRADAQGPERDDSDVDEILYVMEVLAKKRRQNGTAGKTALEAYQEFQQHYRPMVEEKSKPRRKSNVIPFRRIAAVAASIVLVFSLTTTANAFSFRDVWNAVVTWAQETFSFSQLMDSEREPNPSSTVLYESLQDVLVKQGHSPEIAPTWIPTGFVLTDIIISDSPMQDVYVAYYNNGSKSLTISVKSHLQEEPEHIEVSGELIELYEYAGNNFYIHNNNQLLQTAWITNSYECYIAGNLTIEEIKLMIESIGKA